MRLANRWMYKYLSHRQLIGTFDRYNNQIVLRLYPRDLEVIRMIDEISGSRGATILTVLFLTLYRSGTYDFDIRIRPRRRGEININGILAPINFRRQSYFKSSIIPVSFDFSRIIFSDYFYHFLILTVIE